MHIVISELLKAYLPISFLLFPISFSPPLQLPLFHSPCEEWLELCCWWQRLDCRFFSVCRMAYGNMKMRRRERSSWWMARAFANHDEINKKIPRLALKTHYYFCCCIVYRVGEQGDRTPPPTQQQCSSSEVDGKPSYNANRNQDAVII